MKFEGFGEKSLKVFGLNQEERKEEMPRKEFKSTARKLSAEEELEAEDQ